MAFSAKILADSLAPSGARLTTFELTYPRCIHSEFMTHRIISKNAASSRAIPVEKMIQRVIDDPFIPIHWGKNQKGMQADEELTPAVAESVRAIWLLSRDNAVISAKHLLDLGLHKQIANRLLEPWMWITVIASATSWSNFFGLRVHKDAEPHFQKIAGMAKELYEASEPKELAAGQWHLPLIHSEDIGEIVATTASFAEANRKMCKVSVGRCARVSYLTHDGKRDIAADIELHDRLMNANPGHWSPFEHVAQATSETYRSGNFAGWRQYRKMFEQEHIGGTMP